MNLMLASLIKFVIICLSRQDDETLNLDAQCINQKGFKMQILAKRKFIASTATPLVQITFDVYAQKQHFEVQFVIEDEVSKKSLAKNLKKTIANLALVKSELSEGEFLTFLAKVVSLLDDYRYRLFDAEKVNNISQLDLLRLFFTEIAQHEEKQREKAAKKAAKATA